MKHVRLVSTLRCRPAPWSTPLRSPDGRLVSQTQGWAVSGQSLGCRPPDPQRNLFFVTFPTHGEKGNLGTSLILVKRESKNTDFSFLVYIIWEILIPSEIMVFKRYLPKHWIVVSCGFETDFSGLCPISINCYSPNFVTDAKTGP